MLTQISIQNFAIADQVELDITPGMTVITGETGAGKSITLDALGLVLGDRADSSLVRHGAERADIYARFDISQLPKVARWLNQRDLDSGDDCLLRRVVSREGRSRAYINGHPATLQDLKQLGEQLIDIHSQHEHQSLLKKDTHRQLLDAFAGHTETASQVKQAYQDWHQLNQRIEQLENQSAEQTARLQLLSYQVQEFEALDLHDGELAALEAEHKQLSNADQHLHSAQQALALCDGSEPGNLLDLLRQANQRLADIADENEALKEAYELLNSAEIQVDEAKHALQRFTDHFEADPQRLHEVEQRLNTIYEIARKHRVQPRDLLETYQAMADELANLDGSDETLEQLHTDRNKLAEEYQRKADKLGKARKKAAKQLTKAIEQQLTALGMQHCQFVVEFISSDIPTAHGNESIEFLIAPNPGQPAQPMIKIASGGELSRISLAIQVVTAATSTIPTLAFDEVDVGIGGGTAEVVGNLLRAIGDKGQVLCVTHQPQVASKGHQHLFVSKNSDGNQTSTRVKQLDQEQLVEEIARMLGGIEITERTREHAREMLAAT